MKPKADLAHWVKILGCSLTAVKSPQKVYGVRVDSRELLKGELFFALQGKKVDGHSFIEEVARKGAVGAVVAKSYVGPDFGLTLFRVDDVLSSLQGLSKKVLEERKKRIVGVTGSVGKTTTKEFIVHLLSKKYRVGKTPGNANSQTSLPMSILNMKGDEEIVILEMGMTLSGEIQRLVEIAPPEIAVVTKLGHAHIGFFGSIEEIAKAKREIFSHPKTRLGILGKEVLSFSSFQELPCKSVSFALKEKADYSLQIDKSGKGFVKEKGKKSPLFSLPFLEKHLSEDLLASVAVARELGMEWEEILERVPTLTAFERRFEKIEREGILLINDCYNANPESMEAALDNLPSAKGGGKRIAVFGEMVDLGSFSEKCHRRVAEYALPFVDHVFCYGRGCLPMMEVLEKEEKLAGFHLDLKELSKALFDLARPGDVVLIKGSKINALWRILDF